jgi:catechol 2,3-dioxygenase-like lactoylglutathione lyase family enzyme
MATARRIDHPIVCVRDRKRWVPVIESVLGLSPGRAREGDEWGFSNAEIEIGDGFLGVVEPAGKDSQLHRFLERQGEGFYGLSVDVGDLSRAAGEFTARGVPFREARRDGEIALLWVPPRATGGVLYQITSGTPVVQGTNPSYAGVSSVMIAVDDLEDAQATYRQVFALDGPTPVADTELGYRGVTLEMTPGGDRLVLAAPSDPGGPLAAHLGRHGPGLFQFTIDVRDLGAELTRLASGGVGYSEPATSGGRRVARIDPAALLGLRVELAEVP